ncbi:phosphohistidine phosphatase SixA [Desulfurispira natronophila]|uniref:Phosphohistidine phosphatase SixA n=2 Tax=Desulfurispira natronophila TaxID=682562 RepID=A0A7W8DH54_9BACT|nr:phosphohistidine phosphatase SixA [Desulfurispira natronophila]
MADESDFPVRLADAEVLQKMQAGGLVIYMRHGPTDTTQPDQVPEVDLEDCSTQRPLTSEGVEIARQAGQAMRAANIPIGKILVSPMCRTRESAEAAFDQPYTVDKGLMYTAHMTSNQKGFALETINRLLSAPVEAGTNRMLVGHAPNIMDAMGYFPTPEGAVLIFRPRGSEGYEYIATITPELWSELVP